MLVARPLLSKLSNKLTVILVGPAELQSIDRIVIYVYRMQPYHKTERGELCARV